MRDHKMFYWVAMPVLALVIGAAQVSTTLSQGTLVQTKLSSQVFQGNVTVERSLSVERAPKNLYQVTEKIRLLKPLGKKLIYPLTVDEKISTALARSFNQLTFSVAPSDRFLSPLMARWQFGVSQDDRIASQLSAQLRQIRSQWMQGTRQEFYILIQREPMKQADAVKIYNAVKASLLPKQK